MSNQEVLDAMSICNEMCELREKALRQAGEALDAILMQVTGPIGCVDILSHPKLIDETHKALNAIAAIIGTPWRPIS